MATVPIPSQGSNEDITALPINGANGHKKGPGGIGKSTVESTTNGASQKPIYPRSRVELVDRYIDEPRKVRVAVVGGGLSGILAGILLPVKVPGIDLTIYEKNSEFVRVHHHSFRGLF